MTARLSNLPSTRIEKLETFLIERWCLLRIHCEDGTVGTGEAGVHGWPRPAAAMIDEMKSAFGQVGALRPAQARSVVIRHPGDMHF